MAFRNVNVGRGYELNKDLFAGLKQCIETNRPILAMEYVQNILSDVSERLETLEKSTATRKKASSSKPKAQSATETVEESNEES